ncbi:MAG: caspase domain-containing protein [Bdellovibrionales bacterium]
MKRALVVGINAYRKQKHLSGCVNDAKNIEALIARNADGTRNFDTKLVTSDTHPEIYKKDLKKMVIELLEQPADMAFFYFSGHGTATNLGGYLCTFEAEGYDEGFAMQELLAAIHDSPIKEVVVILDCCQSGALGEIPALGNNATTIREGVSILTASRENQSAMELNGVGIFTSLVCDALYGSAADLRGTITPAGVYAHVEQSFGAWDQRPLFKSFVSRSTPLRNAGPRIGHDLLAKITELFSKPDALHVLDKSYEQSERAARPENVAKFKTLKKLQTVGLIQVNRGGDPDLYFACLESKSCQLTALGKFYWHLVRAKKI